MRSSVLVVCLALIGCSKTKVPSYTGDCQALGQHFDAHAALEPKIGSELSKLCQEGMVVNGQASSALATQDPTKLAFYAAEIRKMAKFHIEKGHVSGRD